MRTTFHLLCISCFSSFSLFFNGDGQWNGLNKHQQWYSVQPPPLATIFISLPNITLHEITMRCLYSFSQLVSHPRTVPSHRLLLFFNMIYLIPLRVVTNNNHLLYLIHSQSLLTNAAVVASSVAVDVDCCTRNSS